MEIHFTVNQTHPLKFIFCSEGKVDHAFEENEDKGKKRANEFNKI